MIGIIILNGGKLTNLPYFTFAQIVYGIAIGVIIAGLGIVILTKTSLISDGLDTIFMIALIIFSFGVSTAIDGNAFLTVYLLGIILGNSKIKNKKIMIPFFDGLTSLAQILIFFLLGLLAFPHKFVAIIIPSLFIAIFLTLIARPIAVFSM